MFLSISFNSTFSIVDNSYKSDVAEMSTDRMTSMPHFAKYNSLSPMSDVVFVVEDTASCGSVIHVRNSLLRLLDQGSGSRSSILEIELVLGVK